MRIEVLFDKVLPKEGTDSTEVVVFVKFVDPNAAFKGWQHLNGYLYAGCMELSVVQVDEDDYNALFPIGNADRSVIPLSPNEFRVSSVP